MYPVTKTLNLSPGHRLRELMTAGVVCLPGISDGLSARLVEQAEFPATYLSGGAVARGMGYPDLGLVTLTELEARVCNISEVCSLPLLVDLDSGFGGIINLQLAVSRMERAGAAGLHIDDFETPRRSRDPLRNLMDSGSFAARLKVALKARRDPDFVIIGRTDALPYLGLPQAVDRANMLADLGADLVYVEHLHERAAIEQVAEKVKGAKLISFVSGKGEMPPAVELGQMGYRLVTWPAEMQFGAIAGCLSTLRRLRKYGAPEAGSIGFADRERIVRAAEACEFENEYLS